MMKQQTLKSSFTLQGKGLHTGLNIRITFHPAPENHGYKIRRIDLPEQPVIDALAENVGNTQRGTVLVKGNVHVSTIEHAMAALYASKIDNCLIDVDAPEFPILDGSSIIYISKIIEVGVSEQNAPRKYISFKRKKIKVVDKATGASMLLIPDESYSIESRISFDSPLLKQQYACLTDLSDFVKEFASARTFVFVKEIEYLIQNNLIKGGDLDNAIVIYDKVMKQEDFDRLADVVGIKHKNSSVLGYIMNRSLIYPNEPARHKVLDIIGDLALCGGFLKGKVVANCPGHKINNLFARAIRECMRDNVKKAEVKCITY